MVYTGECRPLCDKAAVLEGTIKETQYRPIHVIVDRTHTRVKISVSRQYLVTVADVDIIKESFCKGRNTLQKPVVKI
jgi:hypothetical protein